jgi:hypothetical protein
MPPSYPTDILYSPLTTKQIIERLDDQGYVTGLLVFDLPDLVAADDDYFTEEVSRRIVGSTTAEVIRYSPHSITPAGLVISVTLDPSAVIN